MLIIDYNHYQVKIRPIMGLKYQCYAKIKGGASVKIRPIMGLKSF